MIENLGAEELRNRLAAAGVDREATDRWLRAFANLPLPSAADPDRLEADAAFAEPIFAQMLADRETGTHLLTSMLRPTPAAIERLGEFVKQGVVDLGNARVEARGAAGYVFFTHLDSLNSEDDETCGPCETAVDLVLLHPELRIGVLRGDPVRHPNY